MKTPLATVKDKFGDKTKLVEAVKAVAGEDLWLGRTSADLGKDRGLAHVSNAKLLRLHAVFSEVKEKFGTRAKLIDAIVELESRAKDEGYKTRLSAYPVPRLYDMYRSATKRKNAATAKKSPAKKAAPVAKKAPAKKAAAPKKKTAAKKSAKSAKS